MRPDAGVKAVGNPEFTGVGFIPDYGFGGNIGDLFPADTNTQTSGTLTQGGLVHPRASTRSAAAPPEPAACCAII